MKTEWVDIPGFEGRYQISKSGEVRTSRKKPKKLITDVGGHNMVVIDETAYYVDDLVAIAFNLPRPDMFNQKVKNKSKRKYVIIDAVTGEEFKSFAAVCKVYGFNYDQFYNSFYTNSVDEVEFGNHFFKRVYE